MTDQLTEFLFPDHGVRGAIAAIRSGLPEMFGWRNYAPLVRNLLGEAAIAMPLLASHSKHEGRMNLQFRGDGELKMLVAQVARSMRVRAMAKADENVQGGYAELMGQGQFALLLEPERGTQAYQAVVPAQGDSLSAALEHYFQRSEQLPTRVKLAASGEALAGILIQRLPEEVASADGWQHLNILFDTLGADELAATEPATILHRLFHAENLRVFEPRALTLACSCSHASISGLLLSIGEQELAPVLAERGKVEVGCEFCGRNYAYTAMELKELFEAQSAGPAGARPQ